MNQEVPLCGLKLFATDKSRSWSQGALVIQNLGPWGPPGTVRRLVTDMPFLLISHFSSQDYVLLDITLTVKDMSP